MRKQLQLKDFLNYTYLNNVQYNQDGTCFAYVTTKANEQNNSYIRNLNVCEKNNIFQLTNTGKEAMYLWDDEETILFSSIRSQEASDQLANGEEYTYFYRINIHGGEALSAFTLPFLVTNIKKLAHGTYLFCANYDLNYTKMNEVDEVEKQRLLKDKKEMQDYEILDELPFYGNGRGFTNKTRNSLFLYNESTNEWKRLSDDLFNVANFVVNDCNLYYFGEDFTSKLKLKDAIYKLDLNTLEKVCVLEAKTYSIAHLLVLNDEIIVLASDNARYGMNENVQFYKLNECGKLSLYCAYEDAIGSSVGSDCRYGGGCRVKVLSDEVFFITTIYNRSVLYKVNKDGHVCKVYDCEGSVDEFDVINNQIVFVGMQEGRLQEIYCCDLDGMYCEQVTHYNDKVLEDVYVANYEPCNFVNDGVELNGWVLMPKDYDATKQYPAILDIHGGPKTVYGEVFYHEMQLWANMGYFVFFMNPRGGDGRGNGFADIRGKYGTIDYDDLMKFTDLVLEKYPAIDQSRVGVTGGSYGGFMTNWIIGHTNRFKAAASQRSIANWLSFAYTSDIGYFFACDQQAGNVFVDTEKLWWHSPLRYANQVKTPTLFIHSDEDYRCPISEGYQMYSALKDFGVDTRMCLFHGENHELSRGGKPRHRVKRLEEITNWFEKYLK